MAKNVTADISWDGQSHWRNLKNLEGGDFFWYEVDTDLEASEYESPYGETFLNGEGVAVVILSSPLPRDSYIEAAIKKSAPL